MIFKSHFVILEILSFTCDFCDSIIKNKTLVICCFSKLFEIILAKYPISFLNFQKIMIKPFRRDNANGAVYSSKLQPKQIGYYTHLKKEFDI